MPLVFDFVLLRRVLVRKHPAGLVTDRLLVLLEVVHQLHVTLVQVQVLRSVNFLHCLAPPVSLTVPLVSSHASGLTGDRTGLLPGSMDARCDGGFFLVLESR